MGVLSTINHFYKTYSENVNLMYHCASLTSLIVLDPTAGEKYQNHKLKANRNYVHFKLLVVGTQEILTQ